MFDKDINFLPQEMKINKMQKKKTTPSAKTPVFYSKPAKSVNKGPESKVIPQGAKPKKTNLFQKIGRLFNRGKNSKNQTATDSPENTKPIAPNLKINLKPTNPPSPPLHPPAPSPFITKPAPLPQAPQPFEKPTSPKPSFFIPPTNPQGIKIKETGVNLIPDDIAIGSEFKNKVVILVITVIICALIIGLSFFGVRIYADSYAGYHNSAKDQLAVLEERIKSYQEYQLQSQETREKVELATNLIKEHISWSKFFKELENITYADVRYTNFLGDITGQVAVDVIAPGFDILAQQLLVFKNSPLIKEIDFSGATKATESGGGGEEESIEESPEVNFNLILKFDPNVFLPANNVP